MANIVIAGDSWAWTWEYWHGTFPILEDDEGYQLQTPIYTYVLSDSGHTVVNVASPGASNEEVISRLTGRNEDVQEEDVQFINNCDCVIIFRTDPVRELISNNVLPKDMEGVTLERFHQEVERADAEYYAWAEKIAIQRPVILIGGNNPVRTPMSNRVHVIPSVMELLCPDITQQLYQFSTSWVYELSSNALPELVDYVYNNQKVHSAHKRWLHPDPHHVNAAGAVIVADKIKRILDDIL